MLDKIKESLIFIFNQINAPVNFEISYINQFNDVDDYEVRTSSKDLPLYNLEDEKKHKEWDTIFHLGQMKEVHSRVFSEYREFVSLIKKEDTYSYSFIIIHIPLREYVKVNFTDYEKYEACDWKANFKFPVFLDYLVEQFIYAYRDTQQISYTDIIRKAGEVFVVESLSSINININHNINILSALKYEKDDNRGNMLICKDIDKVLYLLDVKLVAPISLFYYKKIRKLFEIAKDDVFLVSTPRKVYGFITKNSLLKMCDFEGFQLKIYGPINWELLQFDAKKMKGISLIQCKDSNYQYIKPKFNNEEFSQIVSNRFQNTDAIKLTMLINEAITQSHGTTVVIAENAKEESVRLASSSFLITPTFAEKLTKNLTSIDGAILFDPLGNCHAIGVILDGHTSETEDISNGARHNSAKRYKSINQNCVVIIISEDGHVTCLY